MNRFLSAKHWQLFVLAFGLPFVFEMILMVKMFVNITHGKIDMFDDLMFFPIIMVLCMGTMFCWFWAVVINLQKYLPEAIKIKTSLFKTFFFIPLIYIAVIICYMILIVRTPINHFMHSTSPGLFIVAFSMIFPLHLFSMFCIFYCMYTVAKTFKTVELQRMVSFSDFVGEFFLVWFFPIGIWFIQPKINELIKRNEALT